LTLHEAAQLLRIESDELERLAQRDEVPAQRIGTRWRFNRAALLAWLNGDWKLIVTAVPPGESDGAALLSPLDVGQVTGTGTSTAQSQTERLAGEGAPAGGTEGQEEPIGEAPEERTAEDVFLRGQKVLLAPGEVTIDIGQFYSKSDNQQLAVVSGEIGLATVEQETLTTLFPAARSLATCA
jgi:excisionase family DNA binding protein